MIRGYAKARSHHVSDSLRPKKGRFRGDFLESTARHREWSAKKSELQLGQERQFRGRAGCAPSYLEGGSGIGQRVWRRR